MRSLKNVNKTSLSSLLHQHVWYVSATNLSLMKIHILQVLKNLIIFAVLMQVIRVLTPIYSNLLPFGPLPWRLFWIIIWSSLTYIMLTICKILVGVSLRQLATWYLAQRQEKKQHIDWNQNFAFLTFEFMSKILLGDCVEHPVPANITWSLHTIAWQIGCMQLICTRRVPNAWNPPAAIIEHIAATWLCPHTAEPAFKCIMLRRDTLLCMLARWNSPWLFCTYMSFIVPTFVYSHFLLLGFDVKIMQFYDEGGNPGIFFFFC